MSGRKPLEFLAIGASAGGFDALNQLLPSLASFTGAIAVVLHLTPDRDSPLVSTLRARSAWPVKEAEDKELAQPGRLYVAPRDYHLLVNPGGEFSLDVGEPENFSRPSIDALFESSAYVFGARMAALLLTGANSDGALGLRAVRDQGGRTGVEAPATARFPQMPEAALALFQPTIVGPLDALGAWVKRGCPRGGDT